MKDRLMVRVPKVEDASPGEDLLQLNFFPMWNQGNMVTSLDGGGRRQTGNELAWDAVAGADRSAPGDRVPIFFEDAWPWA